MWPFLKNVFSTVVGVLIALTIFTVFAILIIASLGAEKEEPVKTGTILKIKLNKPLVEKGTEPLPYVGKLDLPFEGFKDLLGVNEIKKAIKSAASDPNIKGILLEPQGLQTGYAVVEEIRDELQAFRDSGKVVFAYGEMYQEKDYYLASVADHVYLAPSGLMEFNGLSVERLYYKGLFEKLEIEPKVFRVGKFKSAVEPFLRKDMSEASRLQTEEFLNSIFGHYVGEIAKSRNLTEGKVKEIADSLYIRNAEQSVEYGLVDQLGYYDEVLDSLKAVAEVEEDGKLNMLSLRDYVAKISPEIPVAGNVAIVVAEGTIVSGGGDEGEIGSAKFVKAMKAAREADNIKAVVVRVNSPGGSALASDIMWREVMLTKKVKPVIASMSDLAASGGYYIAMAADTIVAQPNTITGSIGVFAVMFNLNKFLENTAGLTTDRVKTSRYADLMSQTKEMTPQDSAIIQNEVENIYKDFVGKAAQGRGMSFDDLDSVASGRVWTGEDAKERGLVDVLGGLDLAVELAVEKAGLEEEARVQYYPKSKPLFGGGEDETESRISIDRETYLKAELGEYYRFVKALNALEKMQGPQARLPYDIYVN